MFIWRHTQIFLAYSKSKYDLLLTRITIGVVFEFNIIKLYVMIKMF